MVNRPSRGAVSLITVLSLVGVVMVLAAAMVGVFSLNLNVAQKSFNATVAEAEAEAGIAECLYRLSRDENVDNSYNPPRVSFGRNAETIRATITPGFDPSEAFHVVTFATGGDFPHSTNNTYLDRDTGALGRSVPDGMIHLISTGFCRGQFRTIECLVAKPPFPFGLATSGPIVSKDPFVVKGVSSIANLIEGTEDRPGHLLCNSPEGVTIGQSDPPRATYVSGFIKSVGPIAIAQPAEVLGGLRPHSDPSTLPQIDVTSFRNEGQPGVVTLYAPLFSNNQVMDIMYYFSGPTLTYEGAVTLKKAFLYVDGDLVIRGPVTGEGLIVVNGNATFLSGTNLDGANKMAVLASGDVTIRGQHNSFSGLIFCGGDFRASNITVVGNTIVHSSDPSKGKADLENVTVVSNSETADMTITITSSSSARGQSNARDAIFPMMINSGYFGLPPDWDYRDNGGGRLEGWIDPSHPPSQAVGQLMDLWQRSLTMDPAKPFPQLSGLAPSGPGAAPIWDQATALYEVAAGNHERSQTIQSLDDQIRQARAQGLPTDGLQALRDQHLQERTTAEAQFRADAEALVQAIHQHMRSHANGDGVFDDGVVEMDIVRHERFALNEYLPESERLKIAFWRLHPHRL